MVANGAFLGDPPGVIRIEGLVKVGSKLRRIQIGGDIKINFLIDPSGNVYEYNASNPLEGVTTTVQYRDASTGEWVTWDAAHYEQLNPTVTGKNGSFKWIVPKGTWRVVCEKDGYETYVSESYDIPPERTGLRYFMKTTEAPGIESCSFNNGILTIVYDQYMTDSILEPSNYTVDGATVSFSGSGGRYANNNYSLYCYDTVKLSLTDESGNALTATPESITVNGVYNYNNISIADNTVIVPTDFTEQYNIEVKADCESVAVGDLVTLTLTTTDAIGKTVAVDVSNIGIFDDAYNLYDEDGTVISTEDVTVPETITFDETGTATLKLAAGFEGSSNITFSVGGTKVSYAVNVNAKATSHSHNYGSLKIVEPTCTETGLTEGSHCDICGETIVAQEKTAKFEHSIVLVDEKEPTATENGYTGDKCCKTCGKVIEKGKVLPALGADGEACEHICHKGGFSRIIWNIICIFLKLFNAQPVCECGAVHY